MLKKALLSPFRLNAAIITGALLLAGILTPSVAQAAELQSRSLQLSSVTVDTTATHTARFSFPSTNNVGSIKFEYCTSPLLQVACTGPDGLDASAATLSAQTGESGFSVFSQSANEIILGRPAAVTGMQSNSYEFTGVTNPSDLGQFYLRISSYASEDGTGALLDFGATVGVMTQGVSITTEVPPILNFCVGVAIPGLCDSANGSFLSLGQFSAAKTSYGTTQFMVGTNADFGYVVKINGTTMLSGTNFIPALSAPSFSQTGQSQFGMNLRANTNPPVGSNPSAGGGVPLAPYSSPNLFAFKNGDSLATSASVSDNQRFTVSYIVNINKSQAPGVYTSTFTYTCTATF